MAEKDENVFEMVKSCQELLDFQKAGFERGKAKGKSMKVNFSDLVWNLRRQFGQYETAYQNYLLLPKHTRKAKRAKAIFELKKSLADLSNQADCVFVKLKEIEG